MAKEVKGWTGESRRRVERFDLNTPLDVTVLRSGVPDTVPGRTVDASENGIAAMLAGELAPGETVGVPVQLPAMPEPLRTRAKVKYQDKLRCGLEFLWLSAEERAAIRESAKGGKAEAASSGTAVGKTHKRKAEKEQAGKEKDKKNTSSESGDGQGPEQGPTEEKSGSKWRVLFIVAVVFLVAAIGASIFWW